MVPSCDDNENTENPSNREKRKIETLCLTESGIILEKKQFLNMTELKCGKEESSAYQSRELQKPSIVNERSNEAEQGNSINLKSMMYDSHTEHCEPAEMSDSEDDYKDAHSSFRDSNDVQGSLPLFEKNETKYTKSVVISNMKDSTRRAGKAFLRKDECHPKEETNAKHVTTQFSESFPNEKGESGKSVDIKSNMQFVDKLKIISKDQYDEAKPCLSQIKPDTRKRYSNQFLRGEHLNNHSVNIPFRSKSTKGGVDIRFSAKDGCESSPDKTELIERHIHTGIFDPASLALSSHTSRKKASQNSEMQKHSEYLQKRKMKETNRLEQNDIDPNIVTIQSTKTLKEIRGKEQFDSENGLFKSEDSEELNENSVTDENSIENINEESPTVNSEKEQLSGAMPEEERQDDENMSIANKWISYRKVTLNPKDSTKLSSAIKMITGIFSSKKVELNNFKIMSTQQVGGYYWSEAYSPGCLFSKEKPLLNIWSVEWDGISKSRRKAILASSNVLDTLKGHSGIPHHFMSLEGKKRYYQVLEKVTDYTIEEMIGKRNPFEFNEISSLRMIEKVVDAVYHMHTHGFSHGDLSPYTIRVSHENGQFVNFGNGFLVRLVSFQHGTRWNPRLFTTANALHYSGCKSFAAPETASGPYDAAKADSYSIGALLYYAISNERLDNYSRSKESSFQRTYFLGRVSLSGQWDMISTSTKSLILSCLERNVEKRLTVQQIKKQIPTIINVLSERSFSTLK